MTERPTDSDSFLDEAEDDNNGDDVDGIAGQHGDHRLVR